MTKFEGFQVAFAVLGAGVFTYYTVRHGLPWTFGKIKSISQSVYEFVRGTKNRVVALEHKVGLLEAYQRDLAGHLVELDTKVNPPAA